MISTKIDSYIVNFGKKLKLANLQIEIKFLAECPHCASICAFWSYKEWYMKRDITFDLVFKSYQARTSKEKIPITFVALCNSFPVGMVTIKENDLWSRKDLNPWLASLYVIEEYREKGVATKLVKFAQNSVGNLGYHALYLFLAHSNLNELHQFYQKRGWNYLSGAVDNDGFETEIMTATL